MLQDQVVEENIEDDLDDEVSSHCNGVFIRHIFYLNAVLFISSNSCMTVRNGYFCFVFFKTSINSGKQLFQYLFPCNL